VVFVFIGAFLIDCALDCFGVPGKLGQELGAVMELVGFKLVLQVVHFY
jgi:hypothetical protein